MRRPTRESIEGLRPISRNLSLDLVAAIGSGVSAALVSSLLPAIARRGGLEPLGLAALSAASFLMSTLVQFGVVSVTVGLGLCAVASAIGVVLSWWAARRERSEGPRGVGPDGRT